MHNRKRERALLRRKLEAGVSIHMPAPRRIGKTWTIGRLAGDLRADGWHVIEVDVEGMRTPQAFARDLCQRIEAQSSLRDQFRTHAMQRLRNLLSGNCGNTPLEALSRINPIEFAETLIAALDDGGHNTAVFIDEVAYFFLALAEDDQKGAHAFAYQVRALQQRYKKVRWLITGSIGLDTIARRYGLEGAFVDFETFVLEPFTPDEARSYMRDPTVQQQFTHVFDASDPDFDSLFAELGWLAPYYLKLVANEVRPSLPRHGTNLPKATAEDFQSAMDKLLQPNRRSNFAVWREHVDKNLPTPDRAIAKRLLDRLSEDTNGETADTLLAHIQQSHAGATKRGVREILGMLCNDGLLATVEGRFAFRSGLVRRHWREYEAE